MYIREKKDVTLREARDKALFKAYSDAMREHCFASQEEAIEYARLSSAPRFYIDGNFCSIVLARIFKGLDPYIKGYNALKKFAELKRLFEVTREDPKLSYMTFRELCDYIVELPAPEFYVSNRTARAILMQQRMKLWERK